MESPTERMPIACVHCAKAKAKCDKKVRTPDMKLCARSKVDWMHCWPGTYARDRGVGQWSFSDAVLLQVPCSRCVSKQIVCQSRATRRSSHNPNRRTNLPRPQSERNLPMAAAFHVSQLSSPPQNGTIMTPSEFHPMSAQCL